MLGAVQGNDYDAFVAKGSASIRAAVATKPLKQGYALSYFGQLRQRGMAVYVWKVAAPGAPDEALVRLWLKDGKVGGVVVQ